VFGGGLFQETETALLLFRLFDNKTAPARSPAQPPDEDTLVGGWAGERAGAGYQSNLQQKTAPVARSGW